MTITRKTELYRRVLDLGFELNYKMAIYRLSYKKSFTIYYDGKRDSKTEILNILFNKFKSDFSIHSFTESKTAQLENLYSQMIEEKKEK